MIKEINIWVSTYDQKWNICILKEHGPGLHNEVLYAREKRKFDNFNSALQFINDLKGIEMK